MSYSPVELAAFTSGVILYLTSLAVGLKEISSPARKPSPFFYGCLGLGLLAHLVFLVEVGLCRGACPIENFFESTVFFAVASIACGAVLSVLLRRPSLVVGLLPLVVVSCLLAEFFRTPLDASRSPSTVWVPMHVSLSLVSYTAFAIAFVAAVFYLAQRAFLKAKSSRKNAPSGAVPADFFSSSKRKTDWSQALPALEVARKLITVALGAGFFTLTAGLVLGFMGVFAETPATEAWEKDPKIFLALSTWIVYGSILLLYGFQKFRNRQLAYATIAGFMLVLVTYFGGHWLGSGPDALH